MDAGPDLRKGALARLKTNRALVARSVANHGKLYADCTVSNRQHVLQASALSTVDGRVTAYHGDNG